jgi:hypothetical protein
VLPQPRGPPWGLWQAEVVQALRRSDSHRSRVPLGAAPVRRNVGCPEQPAAGRHVFPSQVADASHTESGDVEANGPAGVTSDEAPIIDALNRKRIIGQHYPPARSRPSSRRASKPHRRSSIDLPFTCRYNFLRCERHLGDTSATQAR